MASISEQVVEEWLRRQGFFTIRGARVGNQEMDILALKYQNGKVVAHHYEVHASYTAIGQFFGKGIKPKEIKEKGLEGAVQDFFRKKFLAEKKRKLRNRLVGCELDWKFHYVVHKVRSKEALEIVPTLRDPRVKVIRYCEVCKELNSAKKPEHTATGKDLANLLNTLDDCD